MKNLVKRFGQFVNEGEDYFEFSPNVGDDNMLSRGEQEDAPEKCEDGCEEFDERGKCIVCNNSEDSDDYYDDDNIDPQHEINKTLYGQADAYQRSKIKNHNMGRMSEAELYEAKKQEKIEALDAIDKKFAKIKPAKKSMPMKPMTKKNMEMEEEEEEESSMKPKMLFGKPVKSAKPETKTNKMPLKGGKPAFLFGKK